MASVGENRIQVPTTGGAPCTVRVGAAGGTSTSLTNGLGGPSGGVATGEDGGVTASAPRGGGGGGGVKVGSA
ncbi:hypothetical protein [Dactylosporangium sp. NPDC005555]|uniref:hypothetical protein n=1 Tax=Dactylosporangium sp. NPDC005555 TaxID=3154889 RepID=UPI0033B99F57